MLTVENMKAMVYFHFAEDSDMLFAIYPAEGEEGKFTARGRLRTYNSPEPFDEKDEKRWYDLKDASTYDEVKLTIEGVMENLRYSARMIGAATDEDPVWVERHEGESDTEYLERWMAQPFVHKKEVKLDG